ncbi:GyrI-like domain-containing protein [Vagococcus zengguangii]|uniref:DNA gyrase inhibitory protein n=1 Tax=Vagococcus zengguangii TaxID=2571750 RepID=A0A4D7CSC0_9ENTE|nr:GyrI-like domain-containing protein [Vagococcus zengguangii]QCI85943.1 DNA gyrase inhibitory protein [Vagococcus zengguangii]TLG80312.1 DNA gyrase inhibitory protein [Vagococcus zengguangii]
MRKEIFSNVTISYMRRTGAYGPENAIMMEQLKSYLKTHQLLDYDTVILGIALDNPQEVSEDKLRYDVGVLVDDQNVIDGLEHRKLEDSTYAVFEVAHTVEGVQNFWANLADLTIGLKVDFQKPIIERYAFEKITQHLCEFGIPLVAE